MSPHWSRNSPCDFSFRGWNNNNTNNSPTSSSSSSLSTGNRNNGNSAISSPELGYNNQQQQEQQQNCCFFFPCPPPAVIGPPNNDSKIWPTATSNGGLGPNMVLYPWRTSNDGGGTIRGGGGLEPDSANGELLDNGGGGYDGGGLDDGGLDDGEGLDGGSGRPDRLIYESSSTIYGVPAGNRRLFGSGGPAPIMSYHGGGRDGSGHRQLMKEMFEDQQQVYSLMQFLDPSSIAMLEACCQGFRKGIGNAWRWAFLRTLPHVALALQLNHPYDNVANALQSEVYKVFFAYECAARFWVLLSEIRLSSSLLSSSLSSSSSACSANNEDEKLLEVEADEAAYLNRLQKCSESLRALATRFGMDEKYAEEDIALQSFERVAEFLSSSSSSSR